MRKLFFWVILLSTFTCCQKDVKTGDIFTDFKLSPETADADGQTTISVSVRLTDKSSTDRWNVIFTTTGGTFTSSGTKTYTAKAAYDSGRIIAKATLRVSTQPGDIKVTAQPEFDSPVSEYVVAGTVTTKLSEPATIQLEPSSYGIEPNFLNEVTVVGQLRNTKKKFVSSNYNVLFEDSLVTGGKALGRVRAMQNTTGDSSKVSLIYSANQYDIGTQIRIRATVLDTNGIKTNITDAILLNINSNQ